MNINYQKYKKFKSIILLLKIRVQGIIIINLTIHFMVILKR